MSLNSFSCLNCKARGERIQVGVRIDLGPIKVEFFAPDELLLLALLHNRLKEAAKNFEPIAAADATQAGMIG